MKYKRFEDLPVWKDAIEFAVKVFEFSTKAASEYRGVGDLKNQLERAAVSISNNIAEGFERGTTTELIQFLVDFKRFSRRKSFDHLYSWEGWQISGSTRKMF